MVCAAHFELWKVLVTQECRFLREQKGNTCGLSKLVVPEIDNRLGYPGNPERLCITSKGFAQIVWMITTWKKAHENQKETWQNPPTLHKIPAYGDCVSRCWQYRTLPLSIRPQSKDQWLSTNTAKSAMACFPEQILMKQQIIVRGQSTHGISWDLKPSVETADFHMKGKTKNSSREHCDSSP